MALLRAAVCEFAVDGGIHEPPLEDVKLAVSEAITNAVIHGYREDTTPGSVRVAAEIHEHELHVVVADEGMGMRPRTDSPGAGLGLCVIAAVADATEVLAGEPNGTELRLRFNLAI